MDCYQRYAFPLSPVTFFFFFFFFNISLSVLELEPVDIVMIEGWMLGFQSKDPLTSADASEAIRQFQEFSPSADAQQLLENISQVNEKLKDYKVVHELIDSWLVYQVEDISVVYQWRLEAENELVRKYQQGLTSEQVRNF
jgi:pantothenate kinase-related protein Tda10